MLNWDNIVIGIFFILGFVVILEVVSQESKQHKIDMAECMKERKEYECRAILDNHSTPYPIIIPMRY